MRQLAHIDAYIQMFINNFMNCLGSLCNTSHESVQDIEQELQYNYSKGDAVERTLPQIQLRKP